MNAYNQSQTKHCYDLAAEAYAQKFMYELDGKPFDRSMLDRFAGLMPAAAQVYDIGCGVGHIGRYLYDNHRIHITGIDYSDGMVSTARKYNPELEFVQGDMLGLDLKESTADGIVAFYAIVHFTLADVEKAIGEFTRVLKPGGRALFSFHTGKGTLTADNFLDVIGATATWVFFEPDDIVAILKKNAKIVLEDVIIRYPYEGKEHPSRRCYILYSKIVDLSFRQKAFLPS